MNIIYTLQFITVNAIYVTQVSSLATPRNSAAPWQSFLSKLLPQNNVTPDTRSILKGQLYQECKANFGKSDAQVREKIQSIIDELAPLNPTKATATNPALMKEWNLEWTTEKEINFFLQNGISNSISQKLSNGELENYIPFVKGGGFGVTGEIQAANYDPNIEDLSCRTEFAFKNAQLDLGKWGLYTFPPVGKGWFDTIYLDDELRIDSNSRNDILICSAKKDA